VKSLQLFNITPRRCYMQQSPSERAIICVEGKTPVWLNYAWTSPQIQKPFLQLQGWRTSTYGGNKLIKNPPSSAYSEPHKAGKQLFDSCWKSFQAKTGRL